MELQDVLRVAGVGIVIALLHIFFEQLGKKEFSYFLFFVAYLYMTIELLRFLKLFFQEIAVFFQWLMAIS
ncbi:MULTISPECIES: stage III sporulation protein AC [Solibacillus]|uniref:Stage III sporulation protein AC n=1 Tax=Solibacillus palustris TaxID=2908203 RepID=A0ABS9UBZ4_9BACL|nr:stage III sporulation protein AC [Solibacillus daqui]MCH7321854.1 stage III sporulation protein AC [Solibacillus sp. MA9]